MVRVRERERERNRESKREREKERKRESKREDGIRELTRFLLTCQHIKCVITLSLSLSLSIFLESMRILIQEYFSPVVLSPASLENGKLQVFKPRNRKLQGV